MVRLLKLLPIIIYIDTGIKNYPFVRQKGSNVWVEKKVLIKQKKYMKMY